MNSVTLKSGKVVSVDLYAITVSEIRTLLEPKKKQHEGDDILGKACGMSADELSALPFPDYRKISRLFWQCVNDPLKDEDNEKNLQSVSISQ